MRGPGAAWAIQGSYGIGGFLLHVAVPWNGDSLVTQQEPVTSSMSQQIIHLAPPLPAGLTHSTGDKRNLWPA